MTNISIKEYKIHNLQREYNKFSIYFQNFQKHIEKCYNENIISINDRNTNLKLINDFLSQLNTTYNNNMMSYQPINTGLLSDILNLPDTSTNILDDIQNLVNLYKILKIDTIYKKNKYAYDIIFNDPFVDIRKNVVHKIGSKIGFYTVIDGITLILNEHYDKLYTKETIKYLNIYDKIFVPLKYSKIVVTDPNINAQIFFKKHDNSNDGNNNNNSNNNNEVLINGYTELYLQKIDDKPNVYIVFKGYFSQDPLNIIIRTSQICNNFIYQKKKAIELYINNTDINEKFAKSYLRNSSIQDILVLSEDEYIKQLDDDYKLYSKLIKLSFMNLMKEFVKDDKLSIKHMYNIIRLLLLGSDEHINIAGLLFGISKEKKPGVELSISDIIFKNLNYSSQIKLRKTNFNIRTELEKIKTLSTDDVDLKKQLIVCKNIPDIVKKSALEKVEEMKSSNNEYYKQLLYVKTILNYPWPSQDDDTFFADIGKNKSKSKDFLDSVVNKLNDKVYGHEECKDSIKELIGKWISNPSASGSSIGLEGPPGVGKTLIAKAIGDALNIPFVQITLGGQNDGEILHGHGYTYSGAQPGMVVKKMVEAGSARCIMYFDELDKACKKHDSNEIYNILIHMIDPNTNAEFQDRFFQEVNFPLNKVLFIFSYNDSSLIDNILMDRIKEIRVKPFKLQDKKIITNTFLMKEMSELVGFENGSVIIDDDNIEYIIEDYTYEPGVRDLRRKLEKLFLKLNIDRIYNKNVFEKVDTITKENPVILNKEFIQQYLGKQNIHIQYVHENDTIGVINGLFATDAGKGGVLPIQIYCNYTGCDDKFTLKLTGSQKRVMRESVISAFTAAMHIIKDHIRDSFITKYPNGFHIHTPSGAVPKDGPSAGCAFATAFVSRMLNKKIRHDIAMTGEIELTGKVTKIGGLQYKLTGAKRAGVKLVLISKENEDDVEKIRKDYKDLFENNFDVKLVENLKDVLQYALVDYDENQIV
jgi:endopeptidase La